MKNLIWIAVIGSAVMLILAACTSPQLPAAVESQTEVETQVEPDAVEEMEDKVESEMAEGSTSVVEEESETTGPTASEIAAMEKAAAGALKDENRAPTFRGNNGAEEDTAEDVDPEAVKSLADYLPVLGPAPEVINGEPWINSDPLTLESLKGKVVLVEFWTYS